MCQTPGTSLLEQCRTNLLLTCKVFWTNLALHFANGGRRWREEKQQTEHPEISRKGEHNVDISDLESNSKYVIEARSISENKRHHSHLHLLSFLEKSWLPTSGASPPVKTKTPLPPRSPTHGPRGDGFDSKPPKRGRSHKTLLMAKSPVFVSMFQGTNYAQNLREATAAH